MQTDNNNTPRSFADRLRAIKPTRWVRFGIVSLIFFAFVVWLGNPWVAAVWLLLVDIYITNYIPWTWWKSKTGLTKQVMVWVDAIVYALILVYLIFAFIGQNYKIPSSSLEKSLLVGDFLWVSKTVYGPRVPNTPIHFPLAQHTMPIIGTKSYIEKPQLAYHRLPGFRSVERGDIVVFNFPQGDTVLTNFPTEDYYGIIAKLQRQGVSDPRAYIRQNPSQFGKIIVRPVDRRENYVKRAVGLPGERFKIVNDVIYINGRPIKDADHVQYNYIVPVSRAIDPAKWQEIGVRAEDYGSGPMQTPLTDYQFYTVPLTAEAKKTVEAWPEVSKPLIKESASGLFDLSGVFPYNHDMGWTRDNLGEIWIPKRGSTLHLTPGNLPVYARLIETYEGNDLKVNDSKIYINGIPTDYYTFKYDYYWMMGDNRDRSLDSRYWGFVPEDHIVGSPMTVLVSFDEERSLTNGKIRWNRILANPNPDKDRKTEKGW